jgi:hypothetical protein
MKKFLKNIVKSKKISTIKDFRFGTFPSISCSGSGSGYTFYRPPSMCTTESNRFLHESLLKIWDFFHECEKFRLCTSGAQRNEWKDAEFLSRVKEIPDLQ